MGEEEGVTVGKFPVTDGEYRVIDCLMSTIKKQLNEVGGSPLNPEKLIDGLRAARSQAEFQTRFEDLHTTVRIGTDKDPDKFIEKYSKTDGAHLIDLMKDLIGKALLVTAEPKNVSIVRVSIHHHLGFIEPAARRYPKVICERAVSLGFPLCLPEVALRLFLSDQSLGDKTRCYYQTLIAMEPIRGFDGKRYIFGFDGWDGRPRIFPMEYRRQVGKNTAWIFGKP